MPNQDKTPISVLINGVKERDTRSVDSDYLSQCIDEYGAFRQVMLSIFTNRWPMYRHSNKAAADQAAQKFFAHSTEEQVKFVSDVFRYIDIYKSMDGQLYQHMLNALMTLVSTAIKKGDYSEAQRVAMISDWLRHEGQGTLDEVFPEEGNSEIFQAAISSVSSQLDALLPEVDYTKLAQFIQAGDIENTWYFIYQALSGQTNTRFLRHYSEEQQNDLKTLYTALSASPCQDNLIMDCFQRLVKAHREFYLREGFSEFLPGHLTSKESRLILQRGREASCSGWGEKTVAADDRVYITHGGGYFYILEFLAGKANGYRLERGGDRGLQVHPSVDRFFEDRSEHYAKRKSPSYLDIPAAFKATIKAKYLDSANNHYEAGLPPQSIPHLKNIEVTPYLPNKVSTLRFFSEPCAMAAPSQALSDASSNNFTTLPKV